MKRTNHAAMKHNFPELSGPKTRPRIAYFWRVCCWLAMTTTGCTLPDLPSLLTDDGGTKFDGATTDARDATGGVDGAADTRTDGTDGAGGAGGTGGSSGIDSGIDAPVDSGRDGSDRDADANSSDDHALDVASKDVSSVDADAPIGDSAPDQSVDAGVDVSDAGPTPDSGTVDKTPPTVVMVTPASASLNAEPSATLQATFSEPLLGSTVNTNSFSVVHDGAAVAGTVNLVGAVATFTPAQPLALLGDYTATLSTAITDAAGNALASTYTWTFRARDGIWTTPAMVDSAVTTQDPQVASDRHGHAIAVWQADSGGSNYIYANQSTWGGSWGSQKTTLANAAKLSSPRIALNASGNGVAAWLQQDPTSQKWYVWAAIYAANAWQASAEIANTADSSDVRVAVDDTGSVFAVWIEAGTTRRDLVTRFWDPNTSVWGSPQSLQSVSAGDASNPEAAARGLAKYVVWTEFDGVRGRIWANNCYGSAIWEGPGEVQTTAGRAGNNPAVAMAIVDVNNSGTRTLLWQETDELGKETIQTRSYGNGGWTATTQLDNGNGSNPRATADGLGNVLAIWGQTPNTAPASALSRRLPTGGSWDAVKTLETDTTNAVFFPQIGADKKGNAIGIWTIAGGVAANRYLVTSDWGQAAPIGNASVGAQRVSLTVDPLGNAFAIWTQGTPLRVWSSAFE